MVDKKQTKMTDGKFLTEYGKCVDSFCLVHGIDPNDPKMRRKAMTAMKTDGTEQQFLEEMKNRGWRGHVAFGVAEHSAPPVSAEDAIQEIISILDTELCERNKSFFDRPARKTAIQKLTANGAFGRFVISRR